MDFDLTTRADIAPATDPVLEFDELVERLTREYRDQVGAATIEQAVQQAAARFAGARIDTFIPLLVERHARSQLRHVNAGPQPNRLSS